MHIGHEKYPLARVEDPRIVYVPAYYVKNIPVELFEKLVNTLNELGAYKVSLSSTLVEKYLRNTIAEKLSKKGFLTVVVDKPVLGCFYNHVLAHECNIDVHVIIAGGVFHPLGLALLSSKPVVVLDPYLEKVWIANQEASKVLRKRMYKILEAKRAIGGRVGLIIGALPGQYREQLVKYLEELAKEKGYTIYKITSSYVTLERLAAIDSALNLDFYIVTSCPRLPIDDLAEFHKPVLTPGEFIMLAKGIDKYVFPW